MKLNQLRDEAYYNAKVKRFHDAKREVGTSLMLIVSELAEALEAHRKGDKELLREEIADTFIRLGDFCGEQKIDIEAEVARKMKINAQRPALHGKKY